MKLLYILVIVLLFGCNFGELPETSQGCKIDRRGIPGLPSNSEHSKALDILIYSGRKYFNEVQIRDTLKLITIEWWNTIATNPSTGQLNTVVIYDGYPYSGLTIGNLCKIAWRGKLFRSAFIHEILHVMGTRILGDPNPNHTNETLYNVEIEANKKLFEQNL